MDSISVLIAPDSFKGSASSRRVGELLEQGVLRAAPDARATRVQIADGGEGTLDAVMAARGGETIELEVAGPVGDPVSARYGIVDGKTAVIEMAEAAGITLAEPCAKNALRASTFGVGQLVLDAARRGARRVLVGLGGSATSDGGAGMACALGARLLDASGNEVGPGVAGLAELASVDLSGIAPEVRGLEVVALTDVTNPLCGEKGAVRVYGPQKGIPAGMMRECDAWMGRWAAFLAKAVGTDFAQAAGAGAAGGLGFGLAAVLGARIERGIEYVLDEIRLDAALDGIDLVITGEGRMDAQSAFGKAPVGVARRAKARGVPVVAVVGSRAEDLGEVYRAGIDLVVPAPIGPATLDECMTGVETLLPIAGETAVRAFLLGGGRRTGR